MSELRQLFHSALQRTGSPADAVWIVSKQLGEDFNETARLIEHFGRERGLVKELRIRKSRRRQNRGNGSARKAA